MNRIRRVDTKEVKRSFVTAQLVKVYGGKHGTFDTLCRLEFKIALMKAKRDSLLLTEEQLDEIIHKDCRARLRSYNDCNWYIREVRITEVGVWRKARSLPITWTNCSLKETAGHIARIPPKSTLARTRVRMIVRAIIATGVLEFQKEKYLLPILFKGGTGTNGRRKLRTKTKWDVDDGCMRSVALTIAGEKMFKAYVGVPKALD
jgi:hypothetical protein